MQPTTNQRGWLIKSLSIWRGDFQYSRCISRYYHFVSNLVTVVMANIVLLDGLDDEAVSILIGNAVKRKKKSLGGHASSTDIVNTKNRPMILIGG
jgi:hypothetical protein